jgi:hypothetical protein
MRRHHTVAAGFALAVLALLGLAWPVTAGQQVPLHGSLAGVFTISGFPIATVSANLTGNATHLGRFTLALPHHVDLLATPPSAIGTFVFIAANGDTVFGTFTGAVDSGAPPVVHVTEIATIEGGTGRFADASGGFTISRSIDLDHLTSSGSFNGTISSPGQ